MSAFALIVGVWAHRRRAQSTPHAQRGNDSARANHAGVSCRVVCALLALFVAGCSRSSNDGAAQPSPSPTLPVVAGDYPAYGYAPDFSWVAGRLVRSMPAGLCTYVVFSARGGAPWGGRLALSSDSQVDLFPEGDMVVVTGSLAERSLDTCGSPSILVRTIAEH